MAERSPGFVAELWTIFATGFLRPPARVRNLHLADKIGFTLFFGLALLIPLFAVVIAILGHTGRLDYDSELAALVICGIAALVASAATNIAPVSAYVTGDKRQHFLVVISWASLLLPITPFLESAVGLPTKDMMKNASFFIFWPAHFVVAGLLGLIVAITGSKLRWIWGFWGVFVTAFGILMVLSFGA